VGSVTSLSGPSFVGTIANTTVTVGRDAVMSCQVQNLRGYKVRQL